MPLRGIRDRSPPRLLARKADGGILTIRRGGRTKKAPPRERIGRRSGFMNSPARSLSDIDPFYCGTRSATICVLLGPKNPQYIPANTPWVSPGLRSRIWPSSIAYTKARSNRPLDRGYTREVIEMGNPVTHKANSLVSALFTLIEARFFCQDCLGVCSIDDSTSVNDPRLSGSCSA